MNIKPIQTEYNGYLFRSRLEARWAVFFDAAGIEYQYEPEGYTGWNGTAYLPDFYLPQFDVYAEVKGTDKALLADSAKICGAIDFDATPVAKGLLVLGDIPYKEDSFPFFTFLVWNKGVSVETATFDWYEGKTNLYISDYDNSNYKYPSSVRSGRLIFFLDSGGDWFAEDYLGTATTKSRYKDCCNEGIWQYPYINECYKKAKQARFEHRNQDRRK